VVHIGVVIMIIGFTFNMAYQSVGNASLSPGQAASIDGYRVTLVSLGEVDTSSMSSAVATLKVSDSSGKTLGTMRAENSLYLQEQQTLSRVGIRSTPVEDLYVILSSADLSKHVASLEVIVNPAVFWVWIGAIVILLGGLIVAMPRRTVRREVAEVANAQVEELASV
jgi:cytochrome c-type biogenesis protein CcmF